MNISEVITNFQFLRPAALLLLITVPLALWLINKYRISRSSWQSIIPASLLKHLQKTQGIQGFKAPLMFLTIAWILAITAIAGPSWQKMPSLIYKNESALVIVLDLSWSMYASDLNPNRLTRTKHKIRDILTDRKDGTTALVVYAGEAYTVAPLTDDQATIANLLAALEPELMPITGSRTSLGINAALNLIEQSGALDAHILLLTDGVNSQQQLASNILLKERDVTLSIIGVGTPQGAPILQSDGSFMRDKLDAIVIPRLEIESLKAFAKQSGGQYHTMTVDNSDISQLRIQESTARSELTDNQQFDQWYDQGIWLTLPLLLLSLGMFRRGWLVSISVLLPLTLFTPDSSYAMEWQDLWKTDDQQAKTLLDNNQPDLAAKRFSNPNWRGKAYYDAGDYQAAAEAFSQSDARSAQYNQANALALTGELEQALALYNKALEQSPDNQAARKNRDIVQQLLDQQNQSQESQPQDNQNTDQSGSQPSQDSGQPQDSQGSEKSEDAKDSEDSKSQQGSKDSGNETESTSENSSSTPDNNSNQGTQPDHSRNKNTATDGRNNQAEDSQSSHKEGSKEAPQQQMESTENSDQAPQSLEPENSVEQNSQPVSKKENEGNYSENQQALEGWLRSIPDDPAGLLRRKFEMQQNQRNNPYQSDEPW